MKAMPWLRVYTEMPGDMKLRRVAKLARAPMASVLSVWVCMLCHAGGHAGDSRGTLAGWDDGTIATGLDLEDEQVTAIHDAMQGLLLAGEVLIGWERRQGELQPADGKPASTSAERMRRMRERKAENARGDGVTNVTPEVTHVTPAVTVVTTPGAAVTPVTDVTPLEERREEEKKKGCSDPGEGVQGDVTQRAERTPPPQPNLPTLSAPKPKEKPPHFLPADWSPRLDDLTLAATKGLDGQAEATSFRDYWMSEGGARAKKRDWDAAFRVWLGRSSRPSAGGMGVQPPRGPRPPTPSAQERADSRHAEAVDELGRYLSGDPLDAGYGASVVIDG
ncbi:hypothetical protein EOD42_22305 [Rhodovarius crocodyli]|uniref:DUF1376 domain-containing protein n=1 Tax=Rhodovarius crocodyli TaxID=1979269 RepID=A0A437M101_9PROT|nr:hypothetical protein [Rhodovarius crocodyli]RVT91390.1 hypothetical protein EOD42_22305 [Rhodovarius crocodyli]